MGTSDAFGGSGTAAWEEANDAIYDAVQQSALSAATAKSLAELLARALKRGNAGSSIGSFETLLRGHRRAPNASAMPAGRSSRTTLSASSNAARGGAAIAGFDAWRRHDQTAASECGLDLSALSGLRDRELCIRIVDDVLGPPSHPDDVATRKALLDVLMAAAREIPPPTVSELLDRFVEALAWELSVVQIATSLNEKRTSVSKVKALETKVRQFIRGSINRMRGTFDQASPKAIAERASSLAQKACKALGA